MKTIFIYEFHGSFAHGGLVIIADNEQEADILSSSIDIVGFAGDDDYKFVLVASYPVIATESKIVSDTSDID